MARTRPSDRTTRDASDDQPAGFFAFGRKETEAMTDRAEDRPSDLVGISAAARELGTTRFTLGQRIRDGELQVWVDPLDRRRRLLRRSELARLAAPRRQEAPMPVA